MIERFTHYLLIEHSGGTLTAAISFYITVLLLINAPSIIAAARRARRCA